MICALGYKSSCTVFAHYPEVLPSGNSFGDRWVFMVSTILLKVEPGAVFVCAHLDKVIWCIDVFDGDFLSCHAKRISFGFG
jgi:hypothetical protein